MLLSGDHTFAMVATTRAIVAVRNGVTSFAVMLVIPMIIPKINMISMTHPLMSETLGSYQLPAS